MQVIANLGACRNIGLLAAIEALRERQLKEGGA